MYVAASQRSFSSTLPGLNSSPHLNGRGKRKMAWRGSVLVYSMHLMSIGRQMLNEPHTQCSRPSRTNSDVEMPRWREIKRSSWGRWLSRSLQKLCVFAYAVRVGIMSQSSSRACSSVTVFHLETAIAKSLMMDDIEAGNARVNKTGIYQQYEMLAKLTKRYLTSIERVTLSVFLITRECGVRARCAWIIRC